jgi:hypothetical protein
VSSRLKLPKHAIRRGARPEPPKHAARRAASAGLASRRAVRAGLSSIALVLAGALVLVMLTGHGPKTGRLTANQSPSGGGAPRLPLASLVVYSPQTQAAAG